MSEDLYAAIGRKQVEIDAMRREYAALLNILGEVASGAIAPSRVTVNRDSQTWAVAPDVPALALVGGTTQ